MKRSRKVKIFLSSVVVIVIGLVSGYYMYFSTSNEETVLGIQESQELVDLTKIPYIDTLPPIVGYEGVLYEYLVRPVSYDDELVVSLEYIEGPSWLSLNNFVLRGLLLLVVVVRTRCSKVSDGYNSFYPEEYILR